MADYPYHTEPTHDTGAITSATRDTAISAAEGRLKVDAVDKVFLLEANNHPFITLLTNVGRTPTGVSYKGSGILKASTGSPEFKCFEDFYGGKYAKASGTYTATGAITITVNVGGNTSPAYIFTVGDVIINQRTSERMEVATVATASTITIAAAGRSIGSTAASAGADGDGLFIIGNANEEYATSRNINMTRANEQTNYTQIFRKPVGVSGTEMEADLYGPKDLPWQRAKAATQHAEEIEMAFWFGEKGSTTGSLSKPKRYTGGILEHIESNNAYVQDQGGPLTAPDLNTFLREGFTYGSSTKMLFCGGVVLQAINEIARGQLQTKIVDKTYGVKISTWQTAFGDVNIVHNHKFIEDYAGYAFLLDMDSFRYRYMNNRDTKLKTNIQANDADGQVDEYITECGLERKLPAKNALIKGITG